MKKTAFAATLVAFLTTNVQADTVGLYLSGQIWQSEASGIFGEENTPIEFNLKKEQQINYFVAFEHPWPLLPNIRISSTRLDTTGKTTLTQAFHFGDETFPIGKNVNASFNVSYIDYTLYYQLLDNRLFSFDLGLTARDFNGAATVAVTGATDIVTDPDGYEVHYGHTHPTGTASLLTGGTTLEEGHVHPDPGTDTTSSVTPTGKITIDDIVPMLYVATNISLPLTNLSIFAQGDFLLIDDHSLYDYQVGLSYGLFDRRKVDFNLTLGYRAVKMEFDDLDNLYTDLEFKGAFIGVVAHF